MNLDQFKDYLDRYCNEDLSHEELQAFEKAMLEDADKRALYLKYMNLDAAIKDGLSEEEAVSEMEEQVQSQRVWLRAAILFFALSGLLFTVFSVMQYNSRETLKYAASDELSNDGVAIITKVIGFDRTQASLAKGTTIKPGLLELSTGLIQLELYSGVSLILEGPASIDIIDPMNLNCRYGQLRAKVPPQAIGFKVNTEDYKVVDLGTEFSISVDKESGRSDFLVHDGKIEVFKDEDLLNSLNTGEGVGYVAGKAMEHSISTKSFRNINTLDLEHGNQRFIEWQNYADQMRSNPDVAIFYDFENNQDWSRTLTNKSMNQQNSLNGAIVGCQWSEGRWEGKGALDYKSISDRVRLKLEGQFESVSLTAWVKIDSFDRWLSSLFLTDDYNKHALHWQLSDVGEIILGVNAKGIGNTFSPPVIMPEHLGQWLYIVTVLDQTENKVIHYLNGKKVHERSFETNFKAYFGDVELGNWKTQAKNHAIRSLNGRIDEFVMFRRALSEDEVLQFYQRGQP